MKTHNSTHSVKLLLLFLISFPLTDIINQILSRSLNVYGVVPRSLEHLSGILFSPWLHANLEHMAMNIVPLFVLGSLTYQWGSKRFWKVSLFIIVVSGILVWLMARSAFHIGASGLIYGYFGFCILAGWLSKRFYLLVISLLVAVFYGSMVWGVLPIRQGMSFEYHLMGCISGLLAAKLFTK